MNQIASVVVITRDHALAGLSQKLIAEGIHPRTAHDYLGVLEQVKGLDAYVAVLDCELPKEESFQLYKLLHGTHAVPTLMMVPEGSYWESKEDPHGFPLDDYAPKHADTEELVLRLKAMMLRAGYRLPGLPTSADVVPQEEKDESQQGETIAVFSVKGGVGKTTIAVNLAVGLVKLFQTRTLIADADLWFGDVGILMNVGAGNSVWDLCEKSEPDLVALQQAVAQHESGTSVLLRPWDVKAVEKMDTTQIAKILRMYRGLFDYVVIDMQPCVDELNLQILDDADKIFLVTTPEIGAIANTCRFMEIAGSLGYTNKISLIVNRANFGIGMERIQERLKTKVAGRVVSAGHKVVDAATRGTSLFVVDPDRKDKVTQDMARIVELVTGRPCPEAKAHKKWLGRVLEKRSADQPKAPAANWMGHALEAGS
jgi:Flp pilus assembly CpaE family ATPase